MTVKHKRNDTDDIDFIAADFVVRDDNGGLSPEDEVRFNKWITENSRHKGAFVRALAVLAHARRARGSAAHFDPDAFIAGDALQEMKGSSDIRAKGTRSIPLVWGIAAAIACLFVVISLLQERVYPEKAYQTAVGEMRVIPLSDGSTITLNTSSSVAVRFTNRKRVLELKAGEVFFEVNRDPDRPFTVTAGKVDVVVVGTKFNLRRLSDGLLTLAVKEGVVDVGRGVGKAREVRRVSANTIVKVPISNPIEVRNLTSDRLDRVIAWRDGMLFFDAIPLHEAVKEFMRYSDIHVLIPDASIATRKVTGYFSVRDPMGFAEAAAESMGLELEHKSGMIIVSDKK